MGVQIQDLNELAAARAILERLEQRLMTKGSWRRGWQVGDLRTQLDHLQAAWREQSRQLSDERHPAERRRSA